MAHGLVHLQIAIRLKKPKAGIKLTHELMREAVQYKATHLKDPKGMEIRIIEWRHGKQANSPTDQAEAWLRFRRLLQRPQNFSVRLREDQ